MKKYKLGLILGRFQGVHIGHESIINKALELCEEVLIFVGSADKKGTKENPFSYELRHNLLAEIYSEKVKIFPLPDLGVGNVPKWGDYVIDNAKKVLGKPDIIIYGDEAKCNTWYQNYPDIDYILIPRDVIKITGTELRKILKKNDEESYKKYTNSKIHKYYNELSKIINNIEK